MNKNIIKKAREFIAKVQINSIPVDVKRYALAASAHIKICDDLDDAESGHTAPLYKEQGQNIIVVNEKHSNGRRRFTILHEVGHIILGLPSRHCHNKNHTIGFIGGLGSTNEERLCDTFAVECLFPHHFFTCDTNELTISMNNIKKLAKKYDASVTATGLHFANYCNTPCAFILIQEEKIKYVSGSKSFKNMGGWIKIDSKIHRNSVSYKLRKNKLQKSGYGKVSTHIWLSKNIKNHKLCVEEAMWSKDRKECLTLLRFDEK